MALPLDLAAMKALADLAAIADPASLSPMVVEKAFLLLPALRIAADDSDEASAMLRMVESIARHHPAYVASGPSKRH